MSLKKVSMEILQKRVRASQGTFSEPSAVVGNLILFAVLAFKTDISIISALK